MRRGEWPEKAWKHSVTATASASTILRGRGFTWGDLDDYLAAQERYRQQNSEEAARTGL